MAESQAFDPPITLLREYPFCLLDFKSTKIIFDNFDHYPKLIAEFPEIEDALNNNLYSGLLQKCTNKELDSMVDWLSKIQITSLPDLAKLEKRAPKIKLQGASDCRYLSFSIYLSRDQSILLILIHLIQENTEAFEKEYQLVHDQLDECHRGLTFGHSFYSYSLQDMMELTHRLFQASSNGETVLEHQEKILDEIVEIQKMSTWLQLHKLTDLCEYLHSILDFPEAPLLSAEWFDEYKIAINTLWNLVKLADAIAQFSRHRKDIGYHRKRNAPWGIDERRYREMLQDFEILKRLVHVDGSKEMLVQQVDKCHHHLVLMDNELLNRTFLRLKSIAVDLSHELEKCIKFRLENSWLVICSRFAQHHFCHYLINTLRYIIIEHIEFVAERKLFKKTSVAELVLNIHHDEDYLYFIYRDNGIHFNEDDIVRRAIEKEIITPTIGDWMLEQARRDIYNLMLKPNFGPPVKPPPITMYKPYLSMICDEIVPIQGHMSFYRDVTNENVIVLRIPKEPNGISIYSLDEEKEIKNCIYDL